MCGLVGLINKYQNGFTQLQKNVFSTLLFVDILRGEDSTGTFLVKNTGDLMMAKEASNALDFMKSKEYGEVLNKAFQQGAALIGHNRKATRGTVTDQNAHPFIVEDKICLVHNGTLFGDHKKHADVEVDSHAIAHLLVQHDVEKVVNTINGAFALIWYDFEEQKLCFLRNKERPLYWVELDDCWLWCSEESMLEFVKNRFNLKFKSKPSLLPEYTLNIFSLEDKKWSISNEEIKYIDPYPVITSSKRHPYSALGDDEWYTNYTPPSKSTQQNYPLPGRNVFGPKSGPPFTLLPIVSGYSDCGVTEEEMALGARSGTLMTMEEFGTLGNGDYSYGKSVLLTPFDVTHVNEEDGNDGLFLWLFDVNNADIIFRYKFDPNENEDNIWKLIDDHAFIQAKVDNKSWHRVGDMTSNGAPVGWVLATIKELKVVARKENNAQLH